ncbi:SpoIIE family protein phosphatase [uncultured Thalassolituus sp.]|uniref:ATP-binding SpoIIE family protein phosphatase n=1 Tax=uncultured Thalassolituus sp. TaxID=285273 RepID=UPI00262F8B82|nr:SpoIIE family protein phosphatase [uncultured Thalassolituus sp.]
MSDYRVLIADDNSVDRKVLSRVVRNQGNEVIEVSNGFEAVDAFREHRPDIVLMDVMMPGLNGKEATRQIKEISGEDFIPVIFLTSLSDAQSLADCLESGGDDFLTKPYNHIVLQAKISSFRRMSDMHRILLEQRNEIRLANRHMLQEQQVAKAVYDNVAHAGCLSASNIRYMLSPLAVFNGDVLLAARKPSGGMHLLLGDFTGHGLPAAIGAMPMADIFYGMTAKGFGLRDVLREINLKLKSILPVGFFCCSAAVDLALDRKAVSVWMGGVPDCYLLRADGSAIETLSSRHLPLGVLGGDKFNDQMIELPMNEGDRLFLWSDGIIESRNVEGEMFGQERLIDIFHAAKAPEDVFPDIQMKVTEFIGDSERDDDTTILEVVMADADVQDEDVVSTKSSTGSGPIDWCLEYRLDASSLKNFNPVPLLNHIMMEVPGLRAMGGQLHTVMAELFSNAFEHGVLGLDSGLKSSADGFMEYYRLREERLASLSDGYVVIVLDHRGNGLEGDLTITLKDSGPGFDYSELNRMTADQSQLSGRGIPLLKRICRSLEYKGAGNHVEAVIHWPQEQDQQV